MSRLIQIVAVDVIFALKIMLTATILFGASVSSAETWRFAMIGDVPYSNRERQELPGMLRAIADSHVDFIVHVGDFKHGRDRCDDALFADRHALFDAVAVPFVFVPGDNEWTDCERASNGHYDPEERLDALRHLFWSSDESLGKSRLHLTRQSPEMPENSRFRLGPVLFVTLNLPGGNNNRGLTETPRKEFQARNPKVLAWVKESFVLARKAGLQGIVLFFQANPGFWQHAEGLAQSGYREFLELLVQETRQFPGEVVAVHGDTHHSRIDHPLEDGRGRPLSNFTRVETFGYPRMGWTRGIVDTATPGLFRFEATAWPPPLNQ